MSCSRTSGPTCTATPCLVSTVDVVRPKSTPCSYIHIYICIIRLHSQVHLLPTSISASCIYTIHLHLHLHLTPTPYTYQHPTTTIYIQIFPLMHLHPHHYSTSTTTSLHPTPTPTSTSTPYTLHTARVTATPSAVTPATPASPGCCLGFL